MYRKKIFGFDLFLRQRLLTKKINLLLLKYYACIVLDPYSIDDSSLETIIIIHRYVQFLDDKKVFQFLGSSKVSSFYPDDKKISVRGRFRELKHVFAMLQHIGILLTKKKLKCVH